MPILEIESVEITYNLDDRTFITYQEDADDDRKFRYGKIIVQHLHQLQNLYFALTGEELAINL